jgi:hypothetical protein
VSLLERQVFSFACGLKLIGADVANCFARLWDLDELCDPSQPLSVTDPNFQNSGKRLIN